MAQHERVLGRSQSHSWPSLKHCSHTEMLGQQSLHSEEQRSFDKNKKKSVSITRCASQTVKPNNPSTRNNNEKALLAIQNVIFI